MPPIQVTKIATKMYVFGLTIQVVQYSMRLEAHHADFFRFLVTLCALSKLHFTVFSRKMYKPGFLHKILSKKLLFESLDHKHAVLCLIKHC